MGLDRRAKLWGQVVERAQGAPVTTEHVCSALLTETGTDTAAVTLTLAGVRETVYTSEPIAGSQRLQDAERRLTPRGCHVGAAHTTGRTHDLAFRAGTALFGHFGIEWDLTAASQAELGAWVSAYKQMRAGFTAIRVVRADHADPALWLHGILSADSSRALSTTRMKCRR